MADMLDKLPVISINELKVGDTILLSSLPGLTQLSSQRFHSSAALSRCSK